MIFRVNIGVFCFSEAFDKPHQNLVWQDSLNSHDKFECPELPYIIFVEILPAVSDTELVFIGV